MVDHTAHLRWQRLMHVMVPIGTVLRSKKSATAAALASFWVASTVTVGCIGKHSVSSSYVKVNYRV